MSCTRTLVETRAPASRHTRAAAVSNGTPAVPEPLHAGKLRGGGHRDRVDSRTGNKQHTRVKDTGATFWEYKELFLGYKKLSWDTRNFFGIQGTFSGYKELFRDTRNFFGIQGTFSGYKELFRDTKCFFLETKFFGGPKSQNISKKQKFKNNKKYIFLKKIKIRKTKHFFDFLFFFSKKSCLSHILI